MKRSTPTTLNLAKIKAIAEKLSNEPLNELGIEPNSVLWGATLTKTAFVKAVKEFVPKGAFVVQVDVEAIEELQARLAENNNKTNIIAQEAVANGQTMSDYLPELMEIGKTAAKLQEEIDQLQNPDVTTLIMREVNLYGKENPELGIDFIRFGQDKAFIQRIFGVDELVILPKLSTLKIGEGVEGADRIIPLAIYDKVGRRLTVMAFLEQASSLSVQCKHISRNVLKNLDHANNGINATGPWDKEVHEIVVTNDPIFEK